MNHNTNLLWATVADIKRWRLLVLLLLVFLLADTYPHPGLSPGIMTTLRTQLAQRWQADRQPVAPQNGTISRY